MVAHSQYVITCSVLTDCPFENPRPASLSANLFPQSLKPVGGSSVEDGESRILVFPTFVFPGSLHRHFVQNLKLFSSDKQQSPLSYSQASLFASSSQKPSPNLRPTLHGRSTS